MAFKNLEQRYNEKVNSLYAGAGTKFVGGKPSTSRTAQPFITTSPGKGYTTPSESRSLPTASVIQDRKRLTLFQISPAGIRFLAKQALLQTGNYIPSGLVPKGTRIINPLFVLLNVNPYVHNKRHLLQGYIKNSKTDPIGPDAASFNEGAPWSNLVRTNKSDFKGSILLQRWASLVPDIPFLGIKGGFRYSNWKNQSPISALRAQFSGPIGFLNLGQKSFTTVKKAEWLGEQLGKAAEEVLTTDYKFLKYFTGGQESIRDFSQRGSGYTLNARDLANASEGKREIGKYGLPRPISYITDPSNLENPKPLKNVAKAYSSMQGVGKYEGVVRDPLQKQTFEDIVTVAIAMGNGEPVKFRAFIKDIQQSVTPEYKPYQYIGRIEKFVTFTTVQRELSFKLSVVAYSKSELREVWRKINYLTGLVYPYGFHKGIYQPNIARLTIGNLYYDQPGYFTGINMNFNEFNWDIDELPSGSIYNGGVPMGADMDMKFNLIEKATKISSSPFYKITEEDSRFDKVIKTEAPSNGGTTTQPAQPG